MGLPFWDKDEVGRRSQNAVTTFWNQDFPDPREPAGAWDRLLINDFLCPGVATVEAEPHRRVDRKLPKQSNHEKVTVTGYTPSDITITIKVWTAEQFRILQEHFLDRIWAGPSKGTNPAVTVVHHQLALVKCNPMMLITSISTLRDGPEQGTKVLAIKGIEYVDVPVVKAAKVKGARATAPARPTVKEAQALQSLPEDQRTASDKPSTRKTQEITDPTAQSFSG
jgi:hypothetical protein